MIENNEKFKIEIEINEYEDFGNMYEVNYSQDDELHFLHFEDGGDTKIINFSGARNLDDLKSNHEKLFDSISQGTLINFFYKYDKYLEFPVSSDIVESLKEDNFECESLNFFRGDYFVGYYYEIGIPSDPYLMLADTDKLMSPTEYTAKFHAIHLVDVPSSIEDFYEFVVEGNRDF